MCEYVSDKSVKLCSCLSLTDFLQCVLLKL